MTLLDSRDSSVCALPIHGSPRQHSVGEPGRRLLDHVILCLVVSITVVATTTSRALGAEWSVPVAGNAFVSDATSEQREGFRNDGSLRLATSEGPHSIYFRVDRPALLRLAARMRAVDGPSSVTFQANEHTFTVTVAEDEFVTSQVGAISVDKPGYVRVDVQATEGSPVDVLCLMIESVTENLQVDCVRHNDGNMFHWGRRGPSVHLLYQTPRNVDLRYAYSEITVPVGMDVQGSYFMANGFAEGYFGIQVNGPKERRVLFSVWSPFLTDNPRDVPEDQRIVTLASGPGVHVGEFGNEGAGGQSYLVYPWTAGTTYRFLTEVQPDETSPEHTIYTSWFGDKAKNEWRLMASFRRPKTQTWLRGFHAFLENFKPRFGQVTRTADYGNVWVVDRGGAWHECTKAKLSADATALGRHRLDYDGGAFGDHFFMTNCGFFDQHGKVGEIVTRASTAGAKPEIDFETLPR